MTATEASLSEAGKAEGSGLDPQAASTRTMRRKIGPIWVALRPFFVWHRGLFFRGLAFALLLVGVRVAMPWPLRQLMMPWLEGGGSGGLMGPAMMVAGIYAVLLVLLGLADYRLRLCFARFAISVVRDLREVVLNGLRTLRLRDKDRSSGDLVTRLVGDSARLKAGMKGFLVHVATNGLMFLGVSAVLLWLDFGVGVVFLSASVLTVGITLVGAGKIFRLSAKQRRKETKLAESISARVAMLEDEDEESEAANQSSGTYEARITRLQGLVTWMAHGILAVALPTALLLGFRGVANGGMDAGDLFIVMLYALMVIGPMVRLARQGARSGKILANADRLVALLKRAERGEVGVDEDWTIGEEGIELTRVKMRSGGAERTTLFGPVSLGISKGGRVAVLGPAGSGAATFLSILSGRESYSGNVRSDGREFRELASDSLTREVGFYSGESRWVNVNVGELGLEESWVRKILRLSGHGLLLKRLKKGDGSVSAEECSASEQRILAMIKALRSNASLTLLDQPLADAGTKLDSKRLLKAILRSRAEEETVVITMRRPIGLMHFDQIVSLRKGGKVSFEGDYEAWCEWSSAQRPIGGITT